MARSLILLILTLAGLYVYHLSSGWKANMAENRETIGAEAARSALKIAEQSESEKRSGNPVLKAVINLEIKNRLPAGGAVNTRVAQAISDGHFLWQSADGQEFFCTTNTSSVLSGDGLNCTYTGACFACPVGLHMQIDGPVGSAPQCSDGSTSTAFSVSCCSVLDRPPAPASCPQIRDCVGQRTDQC